MGVVISGQVGLGCIRKGAEKVRGSRPVSSISFTVSASVPASRFLPGTPALASLSDGL